MTPERTATIRELNDRHRTTLELGKLVMTQGVMAKGMKFMVQVMQKVVTFTDFNADNDPHGEHDFGKIEHDGETVFWKIDYYDLDCQMHSPDEADESVTCRVLTLMLDHEL